jgi:hypothetical protein
MTLSSRRSLLWDTALAAFFKTSFLAFAFFAVLYFSMKGKRMSAKSSLKAIVIYDEKLPRYANNRESETIVDKRVEKTKQ